MASYGMALNSGINRAIDRKRGVLERLKRQIGMVNPAARIRGYRQHHAQLQDRLNGEMRKLLTTKRHTLELYVTKMKGLSPLEKLSSGYSYVENDEGKNVRSVSQVQKGDLIKINVRDGKIEAKVTDLTPAALSNEKA
ncbi:MAG: hypothetical protein IK081_06715 [Lachnospiraceae bacterium]|nr:hypothetical protein [Lachnospiraceae bacterium]